MLSDSFLVSSMLRVFVSVQLRVRSITTSEVVTLQLVKVKVVSVYSEESYTIYSLFGQTPFVTVTFVSFYAENTFELRMQLLRLRTDTSGAEID